MVEQNNIIAERFQICRESQLFFEILVCRYKFQLRTQKLIYYDFLFGIWQHRQNNESLYYPIALSDILELINEEDIINKIIFNLDELKKL